MNERDLVNNLRKRFEKPSQLVSDWMGEDCEVIDIGDPENYLLVSIDTSSENVDFPKNAPPREAGYFCTALSLSDIAACGGDPIGVLVSCSVSGKYSDKMQEVYTGIGDAVDDAGTVILGGDTNSAGEFSLSIVSLGRVKKENVLMRKRAKVGDLVAVTGHLDRFNYGYGLYGIEPVDYTKMLVQPAPIKTGRLLSSLKGITSCIDLPDGLVKSLYDNSPEGLGYLINDDDIPILNPNEAIPRYVAASRPAGDIELLFTFKREFAGEVSDAFVSRELPIHLIGEVINGNGVRIKTSQGLIEAQQSLGFTHKFDDYKLFP